MKKFLDRIWRLCIDENGKIIVQDNQASLSTQKLLHKTIKKVSEDIENINLNTAISQMMILVNELYKIGERPKTTLMTLLQLLSPFGPTYYRRALGEVRRQRFCFCKRLAGV